MHDSEENNRQECASPYPQTHKTPNFKAIATQPEKKTKSEP
jgi:hypothetical protein